MSQDPAAFYRALLAGSRGGRRRSAPVAALGVIAVHGAVGATTAGMLTQRSATWVLLGTLGALAVLLLGLWHLPSPAVRGDGRHLPAGGTAHGRAGVAAAVAEAARPVERAVLLAVGVTFAAALLGPVVPGAGASTAGAARWFALVLLAAVLVARSAPWPGEAVWRRLTGAVGWTGVVVLTLVLAAAAVALATGSLPDPPARLALGRSPLTEAAAVALAVALGGVVLQPALVSPVPHRPGVLRVLEAAGVLVVVLSLVAGGLTPAGGEVVMLGQVAVAAVGDRAAVWVGVALAVVLLAAAAGALTGLHRGSRSVLGARVDTATAGPVLLAVVLVLVGHPARLAAAYAAVVLVLALTVLRAGRREWQRRLGTLDDPAERVRARRGSRVTAVTAVLAGALLAVAAVPGWPGVAAVLLGWVMMEAMNRRRRALREALPPRPDDRALPTTVRSFVVVPDAVDGPVLRALAYARVGRPASVEALTVRVDGARSDELREQWATADLPVPLVELAVPVGDPAGAVVAHVAAARRAEPTGLALVYLPEPAGRRARLRAPSARRLRRRLLDLPGTAVVAVPWTLEER